MTQPGYADRRPYVLPSDLNELSGPTHGHLVLPPHLAWTGRSDYDLDSEPDRVVLYERVLVEASAREDLALLDAALLRSLWQRLFIPVQVRRLWEQRFPALSAAA